MSVISPFKHNCFMPAEVATSKTDQYAEMRALAEQYQPPTKKKKVLVRRRPAAPPDRYAQMQALAEKHCASENLLLLPPLVSDDPLALPQAVRLTGRRTAMAVIAGAVLCVTAVMLYLWVREVTSWKAEARARYQHAILIESQSLTARIEQLNQQAEALEKKADTLAHYGEDLRFGRPGQDGTAELDQAESILTDRMRLRHEAGKLGWKRKMLQEDLFDVQLK